MLKKIEKELKFKHFNLFLNFVKAKRVLKDMSCDDINR